ncbi:MAG: hypothetical protein RL653_1587 [Pseudomonadota bacterium]
MEASGGLVPLEGCLAACGAACEGELEFLVQLAAAAERLTLVTVEGATVVASGDRDSVKLRRGCIRNALDEALASNSTLEAARSVLREFGVQLPPGLEAVLLRDFLWVDVVDTAAYSSRRRVQKMWVETLRGLGKPASAAEVVAEARRRHPGEPFLNPHNATTHFLRSKDVFSLGRDAWCHREYLGVDRATLDGLAEACLAVLPRTPEGSHVEALLKLAGKVLPPELSPERLGGGDPHYVIRDALRHTEKVRSWRNVLAVAFRDVDARRVSIAERLEDLDVTDLDVTGVSEMDGSVTDTVEIEDDEEDDDEEESEDGSDEE